MRAEKNPGRYPQTAICGTPCPWALDRNHGGDTDKCRDLPMQTKPYTTRDDTRKAAP
jgi:hypothetical protein